MSNDCRDWSALTPPYGSKRYKKDRIKTFKKRARKIAKSICKVFT